MWISKTMWRDERDARIKAEAELTGLRSHNAALKTTMDWQMVRLTQLEHERAILIETYMGIKSAIPTVVKDMPSATSQEIMQELPTFEDMGDEAAERAGVTWNELGEVVYPSKKK